MTTGGAIPAWAPHGLTTLVPVAVSQLVEAFAWEDVDAAQGLAVAVAWTLAAEAVAPPAADDARATPVPVAVSAEVAALTTPLPAVAVQGRATEDACALSAAVEAPPAALEARAMLVAWTRAAEVVAPPAAPEARATEVAVAVAQEVEALTPPPAAAPSMASLTRRSGSTPLAARAGLQ